jgi:hypothetical protein
MALMISGEAHIARIAYGVVGGPGVDDAKQLRQSLASRRAEGVTHRFLGRVAGAETGARVAD